MWPRRVIGGMVLGDDVVVPPRSLLLHIGPHKTGTTAIQGAFELSSERLAPLGIRYAGRGRGPMRAAIAAITSTSGAVDGEPRLAVWDELTMEVAAAADERVVISNEFLCEADDDAAARIVRDLGGDRVHVVITLRPWAELLPSQWQQFVRNGLLTPYDEWLEVTLAEPLAPMTARLFWRRHDHAALVDRWARLVGPDRVAVVVSARGDRRTVLQGFEALLGLDDGYLVTEPDTENRSLTLGEAELVRLINVEFQERGWSRQHHNALIRHGVIHALRTGHEPGPDEPRITTPAWALKRASEAAAVAAARIASSGVRVIGDLSRLSETPDDAATPGDGHHACTPTVPLGAAMEAVIGAICGSRVTDPVVVAPAPVGNAREVRMLSSAELIGVLAGRARRRLRRSTPR
jgi:hypothetical protein